MYYTRAYEKIYQASRSHTSLASYAKVPAYAFLVAKQVRKPFPEIWGKQGGSEFPIKGGDGMQDPLGLILLKTLFSPLSLRSQVIIQYFLK